MAGTRAGRGSSGRLNNVERDDGKALLESTDAVQQLVQKEQDEVLAGKYGTDIMHPVDNDDVDDLHNMGSMGPIKPDVGPGVLPGIATGDEQWSGHKDAALVRIAAESAEKGVSPDGTVYYEHAQSSPACLEDQAPSAFADSPAVREDYMTGEGRRFSE